MADGAARSEAETTSSKVSVRVLLTKIPVLTRGIDNSLLEGVIYFESGTTAWQKVKEVLVDYGLSLHGRSLGELIPTINEMTDYDFRSQQWLPLGVQPLPRRVGNALLESGIETVAELAMLQSSDLQRINFFGKSMLRGLFGFLVDFSVFKKSTNQIPPELRTYDVIESSLYYVGSKMDTVAIEVVGGRLEEAEKETISTTLEDLASLMRWEMYKGKSAILSSIFEYTSQNFVPEEIQEAALRFLATNPNEITHNFIPTGILIEELLQNLSDVDKHVLVNRLLSSDPLTLDHIGRNLGVTRERVRQIQKRAERKLYQNLAQPYFAPIRWVAGELHARLGDIVSIEHPLTKQVVGELLPDEGPSCHSQLLFKLANYETSEGWLYKANSGRAAYLLNRRALESADEFGVLPEGCETELLKEFNVIPEFYEAVLASLTKVSKRLGKYVIWRDNAVDRAVTILALHGKPASLEFLLSNVEETYDVRGVRNRFYADPRVMKVSKTEFGLRVWGFEEYSSISEEIVERIDRGGGVANFESMIVEIVASFGVAEGSVRYYCSAPMFSIENGTIRLRMTSEQTAISSDLARVRGAYKISLQEVSSLISVDKDVLRGSGRSIPPALTAALQVNPGQERTYRGRDGNVRITWPPNQAMGGSRGSVQNIAVSLGAKDGDRVLLMFDTAQLTVTYRLVNENIVREGPSLQAVAELTGIRAENVEEAKSRLAEALGVGQTLLKKTLVDRGDTEVASALPEKELTDDVARALAEFANLFQKE